MPRTLRETAALVSLAAAPLVVPYLERLHGPLLPEQKAFLGSVLVVVGVNHRDAIVDDMLSVGRSFVPPSSSVVRRESTHRRGVSISNPRDSRDETTDDDAVGGRGRDGTGRATGFEGEERRPDGGVVEARG